MTTTKQDGSNKPAEEISKGGYANPPKDHQFKKGKSGNPSGRRKQDQKFKSVDRIVQDVLLKEVPGLVGGKRQKMLALEAVVTIQLAKALKGDTRAAKLLLDRADKHVATHQTLEQLMNNRPVFEFTKEEAARFTKEKLMEAMKPPVEQPVL